MRTVVRAHGTGRPSRSATLVDTLEQGMRCRSMKECCSMPETAPFGYAPILFYMLSLLLLVDVSLICSLGRTKGALTKREYARIHGMPQQSQDKSLEATKKLFLLLNTERNEGNDERLRTRASEYRLTGSMHADKLLLLVGCPCISTTENRPPRPPPSPPCAACTASHLDLAPESA